MGTGHTVATLADASELPGVTVAQVNYSTVTDGEVTHTHAYNYTFSHHNINQHFNNLPHMHALKMNKKHV